MAQPPSSQSLAPRVPSAVVFAYHNVGVQCLRVLLTHSIDIPLVVTHDDNPAETIWFDGVRALAERHGLAVTAPADPNTPEVIGRIKALRPDFLFSFYYRHMLQPRLLALARRGALNMHGSLLPKYRGRVPVNWAVIKGETETGATLHYMTEKPDAGDIVDQEAVSILPHDLAVDVFNKVTSAAAMVLDRSLPALISDTAASRAQDLSRGSYFGGRKAEDGRIDWTQTASTVHNLVRGVAPPYPGAFTILRGATLKILRTRVVAGRMPRGDPPAIYASGDDCIAVCADGSTLHILEMEYEGKPFTAVDFLARFGAQPVPLEAPSA